MTELPIYPVAPAAPCDGCTARCCRGGTGIAGDDWSVALYGEELVRFEDVAVERKSEFDGRTIVVLPLVDGKCIYLGDDDRCTIYETRPNLCREFNCAATYASRPGVFSHSTFLRFTSSVRELIEKRYPQFCADRKAYWLAEKARREAREREHRESPEGRAAVDALFAESGDG